MKLPDDVREKLRQAEWQHTRHFGLRLLNERTTVSIGLDAPQSARKGMEKLPELQAFVRAWQAQEARQPGTVQFEGRSRGDLGGVDIPVRLVLPDTMALAIFLGGDSLARLRLLFERLAPFEKVDGKLGLAARRCYRAIEHLDLRDVAMLHRIMPQLSQGMGAGLRLRAVPFEGVDTKFVENNLTLIQRLADLWFEGAVSEQGGLEEWLGCEGKGEDRLLVKPLCGATRAGLGGLRQMWVTSDDLRDSALPGRGLLIVENETSAQSLPELSGVVAVAGTGNNLAWMGADWVRDRVVGYWGDLDSWGIELMRRAQVLAPHLDPLMMDVLTYRLHEVHVVDEPTPFKVDTATLSSEQVEVMKMIDGDAGPNRLEQEFIKREHSSRVLKLWCESSIGFRAVD